MLAVAQAVADFRRDAGYEGYILIGGDTRLMSAEVARLCARVLIANGAKVMLADHCVPTPVFSLMVLHDERVSDAIIGTASHNPPQEMGIKYNPEQGGPAPKAVTDAVQAGANRYLAGEGEIRLASDAELEASPNLIADPDLFSLYLRLLTDAVGLDTINEAKLGLRIHPLGGAAMPYFKRLTGMLPGLTLVNETLDPSFGFIPLDHDGKIRMDPSSRFPMRPLLEVVSADRFEMAGATDPDADRFGVATGKSGLLNPNHALCIAADYLLNADNRPTWPSTLKLGRTIGTTHLLDRIAEHYGREIDEMDVGFKYFVDGLYNEKYALVGEESAGLSFYRWSTEKDGIAAVLLFAEIMAKTGKDLGQLYEELTERFGKPAYARNDQPATDEIMGKIRGLKKGDIEAALAGQENLLAGYVVVKIRDTDGIKLYLDGGAGWVLVRPSGTEAIVKFYTESFVDEAHRQRLEDEAKVLFGL